MTTYVYLHEGRTLTTLGCGSMGNALNFHGDVPVDPEPAGRVTCLYASEDRQAARRVHAQAAIAYPHARTTPLWNETSGALWEVVETGQLWTPVMKRAWSTHRLLTVRYAPPFDDTAAPHWDPTEPLWVREVPHRQPWAVYVDDHGAIAYGRIWRAFEPGCTLVSEHPAYRFAFGMAMKLGVVHVGKHKRRGGGGRPGTPVRCVETGETWPSITAAARAHRVTPARIHHNLVTPTDTVLRKWTFQRIEH